MKILKINRAKWGIGAQGGLLLNPKTEKYCCLGFFCRQVGYKDADIKNISAPANFIWNLNVNEKAKITRIERLKQLLFIKGDKIRDNKVCQNLMAVNDSESKFYSNNAKRESRIKELFKKIGVTVKFSGDYSKK